MGFVILSIIIGSGCLWAGSQHPKADTAPVTCSESLASGQNMIVNETQNNAKICSGRNVSVTIRLTDSTRNGHTWNMKASPGLLIADHGLTWVRENGTLPTSFIEHGYDEWLVTTNEPGIQTIQVSLHSLGEETENPLETYNLTIVVR